jgi:serine/threonine protein kinase
MADDERLLSIATAIVEGAEVSWSEETQRVANDDAPTLNALRDLEQLLTGLRQADRGDETPPTATPRLDDPSALRRWRHLTILGTTGYGSFGTVYRAHDERLGIDVALKLLPAGSGAGQRTADEVLREAQLLARVRHPNVVQVYGADHDGERVGLWMELVEGRTLSDLLRTQGPFSAHETALIGRDLCRALAAVHRAGVLHGDIKAHNVMREAGGRIVLMDFGAGGSLTSGPGDGATAVAGTPVYLAPEVLNRQPRSASSDIYALGVLLYHLATDSYPVVGRSVDALRAAHGRGERRHLRDARPDLPQEFVRAVEHAIAPDPAGRFASLGLFEDALARVMSPGELTPSDRSRSGRAVWVRRWTPAIAAAVVVAVGGVTLGWRLFQHQPPSVPVLEQSAAAPAPPAPGEQGYEIQAAFFRSDRSGEQRLDPQARLKRGDELFLRFEASVPIHLYVVNEDDKGAAFLLFPLAGSRLTNPLTAGETITVPDSARWRVTSAGEREHFLVFASPEPLESLEQAFARLDVPRAGAPIDPAELPPATVERLRGVGGLTSALPSQSRAGLSQLFTAPLPQAPERTRGLWVRQLTLDNPTQ